MAKSKAKLARPLLEFFLDDDPIGCFQGDSFPSKSGWYAYSPYRGEGHLRMIRSLRNHSAASAWYEDKGVTKQILILAESFDVNAVEKWKIQVEIE